MPLESLHALVETLRQRIERHRSALSGSEWLTRYTIIDPLLRELGWNTEDPDVVIPEYRSGSGSADYALLSNDGKPAMMIEAKKLGTSLSLDVVTQVLNYCWAEGTEHFAVTDGQQWQIYETNAAGSPDDKRVASFNLLDASPSDVCLKALALWRQNIASGQVGAAQTPVVTLTDNTPTFVQQPESSVAAPPTQATPPAAVADANGEWVPLTEFQPSGNKPTEIMFPDNSTTPIRYWVNIIVESTRWLIKAGHLDATDCPIKLDGSQDRHLVHIEPAHPNGDNSYGAWEEVEHLWVEKHGSSRQIVRNTRIIIERIEQDPSQFKVRW